MKEAYFQFKNNKIYYSIYGQKSENPPIICVHGGPGVSHHYLLSLKDISISREVIFYDQLGCGLSDRPNTKDYMNIEYFYEELKAFIDFLGYDKVILLGQSFGGTVVLEYLLNTNCEKAVAAIFASPALSAKQFVIDAQKRLKELPAELLNIIEEYNGISSLPPAEFERVSEYYFAKFVMGNVGNSEELAKTFELMNNEMYNHMWGPTEFEISGNLKDYDRSSEIEKIKIPVLFTCGEFDEVSSETCQKYSDSMVNSKLFVIKDAAHMAHLEKKDEYNELLSKFISESE